MILVSTAAPLVSSALSVLLQNAPSHIPLEKIKGKVLALDGVLSIHEFHGKYKYKYFFVFNSFSLAIE